MHMPSLKSEETGMLPPAQAKKWDKAEQVKFKRLVKEGKIDPKRSNKAYIEKICKKEWGDWKLETFRWNCKVSTAEFCIAAFKDGARAKSAAEDKGENNNSCFFLLIVAVALVLAVCPNLPSCCVHFVSVAEPNPNPNCYMTTMKDKGTDDNDDDNNNNKEESEGEEESEGKEKSEG
jgi:hypothetical protein